MALPEWLADELNRREDGITGFDSMDTRYAGPDGSRQSPGEGELPSAAQPWTKSRKTS